MTSRRTAISAFAICVLLAAIAGGQQDRTSQQKEPQFSAPYVPNHAGEWLHEKDYSSANVYRLTPADQSAFTATLEQVEAIFRATPMMNPPHGFNAFARLRYIFWDTCSDEHPCPTGPAQGEALLSFRYFVDYNGRIVAMLEDIPSVHLEINDLFYTYTNAADSDGRIGYEGLYDESGQEVFVEPLETARVAGFPLYEHDRLIMTRIKRPYWLNLTREEYLRAYIHFLEGVREHQRTDVGRTAAADPYGDWMKEKETRRREFEKGYAEMKKTNPAMAEELRRAYEQTERETAAGLKASSKPDMAGANRTLGKLSETIAAFKTQLAEMGPDERKAVAWIVQENTDFPALAEPGTEGARKVARVNPDFFDPSARRTDVQVIVVAFDAGAGTSMEEAETASVTEKECALVYKFMQTCDWKKIGALLAASR